MPGPPSHQPPNLFPYKNDEPILGNRNSRRAKADPDQAVRSTDNDASVARFSAVSKKYIDDEFARFFISLNQNTSRPPWINIGTHHRTYIIDALVESFIKKVPGTKQVISLGAGSDSRYWRLKHAWGEEWSVEKWLETDFQETVSNKIRTIMSNNQLKMICGNQIQLSTDNVSGSNDGSQPPTELHAKDYSLVSLDLRQSDQFSQKLKIDQADQEPLLKRSCPTLIIAELVFLYMSPEQTKACLKELASIFEGTLMIIVYEALNLNDNFSKMMIQNLSSRGLSLPGFNHSCSVEFQIKRLQELEFTEITATDMKKLRESTGPNQEWKERWDQELTRIRRLEFLDEVEELELVLQHYAISWGIRKEKFLNKQITHHFYLPHFSEIDEQNQSLPLPN